MEVRIKDADYNSNKVHGNAINIEPGGVSDSIDGGASINIESDGGSYSLKANNNTKNWESY